MSRSPSSTPAPSTSVTIHELEGLDDIAAASELWRRVWDRSGDPPVPAEMLRALSHAGNYLAAAFEGPVMVGALLGFLGGAGHADHLHSHILGVDPAARGHGIGFALKAHQRQWALARGLDRIEWTYDPLVRANGYFNLSKLGAQGVQYLVNFYGAMPDSINGGDESDRILVRWDLNRPRVVADLVDDGDGPPPTGAVALSTGGKGEPQLHPCDSPHVFCQVPSDIVALRVKDAALAREWRTALREVMTRAFDRGLTLRGMSRDGWYLLS